MSSPTSDGAHVVGHGLIAAEDLQRPEFVDSPADALELLQAGLAAGPEEPAPAFAR